MRIAVIYSSSLNASWAVSDGIVNTLRLMGHQVLDLPQSMYRTCSVNWWSEIDNINNAELVIMAGPEYAIYQKGYCGFMGGCCVPDFEVFMGKIKPPKFAIYHESNVLNGYTYQFDRLHPQFKYNFYPYLNDAMRIGGYWMPFTADTSIFYPQGLDRTVELGFIGGIYPERQSFICQYQDLVPNASYVPVVSKALVQDIDGIDTKATVEKLALSYNKIKIFICYPSVFPGILSKATEAMACGCCVLHPRLTKGAEGNAERLKHENNILFYDSTPAGLYEVIKFVKSNPDKVEQIGVNAAADAIKLFSLRLSMERMLTTLY